MKIKKGFLFFLFYLVIGTITLSGSSLFEGINSAGDLVVFSNKAHDALWHIALEESIKRSIPPLNPLFIPERIQNYHYLTDVLIVFSSLLTNISIIEMFLKWIMFILGGLFVFTTFLLFFNIYKRLSIAYLGTSLIIFSSSLAYFLPHHVKGEFFSQSIFWLDQPTRYLVNPQLMLSLIIFNILLLLIFKSAGKYWILISILIGLLAGVKVYGFIILVLTSFFIGLLSVRDRNTDFLKIGLLSCVVAGIILFFAGANSDFPFIFSPGWFISSMYQSSDRLNFSEWEIHRQLFLQTSNYPRLIFHWLLGFIIFFLGNFGFKILGLPIGIYYLKQIKTLPTFLFFCILSLLISIILPMSLLQKGVVWNTIQFLHYAQIPLVILIVYFLSIFKIKYQIAILITILILGMPVTMYEIRRYFDPNSYIIYNRGYVEGLDTIGRLISTNDTILVGSDLYGTSIVPALIKKPVFYADQGILDILRISTEDRRNYIQEIERGKQKCKPGEIFIFGNNPYLATSSSQIIFSNDQVTAVKCEI